MHGPITVYALYVYNIYIYRLLYIVYLFIVKKIVTNLIQCTTIEKFTKLFTASAKYIDDS